MDDLHFEDSGPLVRIVLNRPKALNALTLEMIRDLDGALRRYRAEERVKAVVIEGTGDKAFCAGGDVLALYNAGRAGEPLITDFFREEYRLNHLVHTLGKPYIAVIDGVVMGGGVGVSVHGSHRIATERTMFAMPEAGIGMFPDVGATWFLSRMPGALGVYLGLTGARLKAADCLHAGIATHYARSDVLPELGNSLATAFEGGAIVAVDDVLAQASDAPGSAPLAKHRDAIERCFSKDTLEEIRAALAEESGEWAAEARAALDRASPFCLKLALRQIRSGASLAFDEAMRLEFRLSQTVVRRGDFYEGIRALLIDRDRTPRWDPPTLEAVSDELVAEAFETAPEDDLELD